MLWILSAEMQKWFDQNHTSRSASPISAVERGFDARLRLVQVDRPAGVGNGIGGDLGRHLVGGLLGPRPWSARRRNPLPLGLLLRASGHDPLGLPLGVGIGDGAEGLGAAWQRSGGERAGARPVELGEQRAARIRFDGRDRSRARSHPKTVQRQHRLGLRGLSHWSTSITGEVSACT